MCEWRTYELAEIRYGMILSRYLLTPVEFFSFFVNIDERDEGLWSTWVRIIFKNLIQTILYLKNILRMHM